MTRLFIPVSCGEAADKITILQIKRDHIRNPAKLANIEKELASILQAFAAVESNADIRDEIARLRDVNRRLWDVEEEIREHECRGDFGAPFVQLARRIYQLNDERARVKRNIDIISGSPLREEKSYVDHNVTK
jgi:hypothetical protein